MKMTDVLLITPVHKLVYPDIARKETDIVSSLVYLAGCLVCPEQTVGLVRYPAPADSSVVTVTTPVSRPFFPSPAKNGLGTRL